MAIIESFVDAKLGATQRMKMAALFHALADPTRLLILVHLKTGEHKVKELTEHLGLAQSTVSAHLACLRESDLVSVRTQGRASLYSLTETTQLTMILTQAEKLASSSASGHRWHEAHPHQSLEA
ncbi:ArsR family transcriptional regulator [Arthrobacter sp. MYb211]|uniref:ArsR/SmtB family transcription factor n=2 Tax=Micrococcaceae TaxID=1268 RepID=UPI000BB75910|nr:MULTISPECIES: metalloregulator ArsR/SmtB family transcription factor [Micrococcaceae]PCC27179.1 ArsR family transcriptional regulator [Glutamicibacter sp. BW80]PQZ97350.1 ArsR family transcriptional regulator [Arthrobacter sp. MYb224]PRA10808.1 ArsR family transcriptional regulator [Arthrobacter sp. MYb221]PRC06868.1 ArsR family transcriptional regulator [Arthrobacter sp. MYb211]